MGVESTLPSMIVGGNVIGYKGFLRVKKAAAQTTNTESTNSDPVEPDTPSDNTDGE